MPADPGAPSGEDAGAFSWARSSTATEAARDDAAERRRARRRRWVRPHSLTTVLVVALVDAVVLAAVSGYLGVTRENAGRPCATFWADLAGNATTDIRVVIVVLAVILLLCVRRRWIFVAALVVQLTVAAVLLPSLVHNRAGFIAVAEGRETPAQGPSVQLGCDSR